MFHVVTHNTTFVDDHHRVATKIDNGRCAGAGAGGGGRRSQSWVDFKEIVTRLDDTSGHDHKVLGVTASIAAEMGARRMEIMIRK